MDRKINKLIAIAVSIGIVWMWMMGFFGGVSPFNARSYNNIENRANVSSFNEREARMMQSENYMYGEAEDEAYATY